MAYGVEIDLGNTEKDVWDGRDHTTSTRARHLILTILCSSANQGTQHGHTEPKATARALVRKAQR